MRFSLVVATIGRVSEVERLLESIDSQTHRELELILVDQNEDERLSPLLAVYRERLPVLHLRSEPGLSRARNVGLRHVFGDVVAFPDDDAWYPPDLFERIAGLLRDHPHLDGLTGRVVEEHSRAGTRRFGKRPGLLSQTTVWTRATSASLFLRRATVKAVGEFDEALGIGSGTIWEGGEDIDYALRAVGAGFKVYYKPDIHVFHASTPEHDYPKLADRAYRYGAGIGRVWKKHHYPLWLFAYYLLRPVAGITLSLVQGHKGKALYYSNAFRGRLRGWLTS